MSEPIKNYRCTIYTRKSHEEGLEQELNSPDAQMETLKWRRSKGDAQRESGEAYIQLQKKRALIKKHYDDGGFSGFSLNH